MAGSAPLLTDRDRRILAEVSRFGAMTREQIQALRFFHSATRAKTRLKRLTDAGYLRVRLQPLLAGGPKCVYLPGDVLGPSVARLWRNSPIFLQHQLGLVDIRIAIEQSATELLWRSDKELAPLKLSVVPDAYVECQIGATTIVAFVEYDRATEPLGRIERKAKAYLDLAYSGTFTRLFNRKYFRVLVIADGTRRRQELSRTIARLTDRVFRLAVLSELKVQGLPAAIWRRPGADAPEPLIDF